MLKPDSLIENRTYKILWDFDSWLVRFYGISNIVGYSIPNFLYTYVSNIYDS